MINNYYKEKLRKEASERIKISLKKKNTKSANMLVSHIEIFLKKKKKRSVNMVVEDIRIVWRMSIEKIFLEWRK